MIAYQSVQARGQSKSTAFIGKARLHAFVKRLIYKLFAIYRLRPRVGSDQHAQKKSFHMLDEQLLSGGVKREVTLGWPTSTLLPTLACWCLRRWSSSGVGRCCSRGTLFGGCLV